RFDSDKTTLHVCEDCGMVAIFDNIRKKGNCPKCGANAEVNAVDISYAFKLLLDELKSLGIYPKISLKNKY
ncbi:DNA-directed RNA polymerase subunit B, partial [archaeon]|nr:DNA-directed RNA polymerase subunit B [archaeon]